MDRPAQLEARLGLLDATTLVMGSMIGSGIFIVAADIARQVQSPALLLGTWILTTLLTVTAALSYGELAAMMPQAGGQYVYLRESFGPLWGFLYGWTLFVVIQTGTLAAVAVAFAKFTAVFLPALEPVWAQRTTAIAVLVFLTWVNTRGVKAGAIVQNIFTIAKAAALFGLIVLGVMVGRRAEAIEANFGANFWPAGGLTIDALRLMGVAMVGALFSADAWNNVTFIAGEIRNPKRNLPLALALGVGVVCLLYLGCNVIYLSVLPLEAIQNAPQDRVATAVIDRMIGSGAMQIMAVVIMISTFGCLNGMILAGARAYYAMALDGLFFQKAAQVDPVRHTPVASLVVQCVWAAALTLSGRYSDLLDYVIFAVLLFYILTIAGLFVLRRRKPEMERPYRAIGYPVLPALYIVVASVIEFLLLLYKPSYTWPGLLLVVLGVPVYFLWRRKEVTP